MSFEATAKSDFVLCSSMNECQIILKLRNIFLRSKT